MAEQYGVGGVSSTVPQTADEAQRMLEIERGNHVKKKDLEKTDKENANRQLDTASYLPGGGILNLVGKTAMHESPTAGDIINAGIDLIPGGGVIKDVIKGGEKLAGKVGEKILGKGAEETAEKAGEKILGKEAEKTAEKEAEKTAENTAEKGGLKKALSGLGLGGSGGSNNTVGAGGTPIQTNNGGVDVANSGNTDFRSSYETPAINTASPEGEAIEGVLQNQYNNIKENNTLNREARDRASAESRGIFG